MNKKLLIILISALVILITPLTFFFCSKTTKFTPTPITTTPTSTTTTTKTTTTKSTTTTTKTTTTKSTTTTTKTTTTKSTTTTIPKESKVGLVENIYTAYDIPDDLMNDKFKTVLALFSTGYSQSGLDIKDARTNDNGETYIFYFDDLEFLEDECEIGSNVTPRIIYSKDAINNNGTPNKIFFGYYNPLKSNGYKETVKIVKDIADALDISKVGLIDNNYTSSSKLAIGEYAKFTFINLKLELTVTNTDGTVEIEITPID